MKLALGVTSLAKADQLRIVRIIIGRRGIRPVCPNEAVAEVTLGYRVRHDIAPESHVMGIIRGQDGPLIFIVTYQITPRIEVVISGWMSRIVWIGILIADRLFPVAVIAIVNSWNVVQISWWIIIKTDTWLYRTDDAWIVTYIAVTCR